MDNLHSGYGRCTACGEIKQVGDGGLVQAHNRYDADGTSVAAVRCPGSDREPSDAPPARVAS